MGFLLRILYYLFLFLLYAGVLAAISLVFYYAAKGLWYVFEYIFQDQAEWVREKFNLLKPVRSCSTIIVTAVVTVAVIVFIWFVFLAGQGARGGLFP